MKTRLSFVTNSSSSSFIVVGVDAEKYADKFKLEEYKERYDEGFYLTDESRSFMEGLYIESTDANSYGDVISIINVEEKLETMTIQEIKQLFIQQAKENGVDIDPKDVYFDYGGYYNG